jgi:hypothetical protein
MWELTSFSVDGLAAMETMPRFVVGSVKKFVFR